MENNIKSYPLPLTFCPQCGHKLDGATQVEEGKGEPEENDLTVCWYCGRILLFNADLSLRVAGDDDLKQLDDSTLIMVMQLQAKVRNRKQNQRS